MRRRRSRTFAVVAYLLTLWSSLLLATPASAQQPPAKAGIVTTLKGQATVARAALPSPSPLNFRDDVYFRDRIGTERDAVVRVLMGGKALVTIRELSDVTITEEPNRSVVRMGLGRLALQVVKGLMRRGEIVEIHTPNAVAAVRGSFVDVQTQRVNGAPQTILNTLGVEDPVPVADRPTLPGASVTLQSNQTVTFTGPPGAIAPPTIKDLTLAQQEVVRAAYRFPLPPGASPLQGQISARGMDQAAQLAAVVNGDAGLTGLGRGFDSPLGRRGDISTSNIGVNDSRTGQVLNEINRGGGNNGGGGFPPPPPGSRINEFDVTLTMPGTYPHLALGNPARSFAEGSLRYIGPPVTGARIFFNDPESATRFAFDNLTVRLPTGPLTTTFDENPPGFRPINDVMMFKGVRSYLFTEGGSPSTDANFKSSGPGSITFVQDPSLEGSAFGELTLIFDGPVGEFLFGLARNRFGSLPDGYGIEIGDLAGIVYVDYTNVVTSEPLLDAVGSRKMTSGTIVEIDWSLVDATAPLMRLLAGSRFTSGQDAVQILARSNVSVRASEAIRLDASQLNVLNGDLVRAAGRSRLNVTGDFLSMLNNSRLNILNGVLLNVMGESAVNISGAFVRFGGTGGNVITVGNSLVPTGFFNGIPVHVSGGGSVNVTNPTPLVGLNTLGTIKINGAVLPNGATAASGITGSLIDVRAGGTVKIGP